MIPVQRSIRNASSTGAYENMYGNSSSKNTHTIRNVFLGAGAIAGSIYLYKKFMYNRDYDLNTGTRITHKQEPSYPVVQPKP
jgi:hypothetical protein